MKEVRLRVLAISLCVILLTGMCLFLSSTTSHVIQQVNDVEVIGNRPNYQLAALGIFEKWSYPIPDTQFWSSPATYDLNDDGYLESIFGTADFSSSGESGLFCVNYTGDLEWSFDTGDIVRSSPSIADIDKDGHPEIIVGSDDGHLIILNHTGG
ncbi:MAG: hypothetical protein E3J86_11980, partial [Candidatus Thorarchaeota archaeon]